MNSQKVIEFRRRVDLPAKTRQASPPTEENRIERQGKLLFLKKQAEPTTTATAKEVDDRHIIIAFIEDALRDPKNPPISKEEEMCLRQAIAPLIVMFSVVDKKIFDDTRDEYRQKPKPPPGAIADKEARYWSAAKKIGFSPIPGFDMEKARVCFIPETARRTKRVHFLRQEWWRDVEEYPVPYRLRYAEMFFFIILRMFRRQCQYTAIRKMIAERRKYWAEWIEEKNDFKMSIWDFLKSFF